ncbi:MAG: DMT family transporter [Syntrophobacteraceae bacterium]
MSMRSALDGRAIGLMILFCAIFGMQQVAIKAATPAMDPVLQIAIRSGIATLLIGLYLRAKGTPLLPSGKWLPGFAAGILFTAEYLFVAEGLRFTSASRMVIMLYTAPAFAAFGLHFLIAEERLRPMQWAGMALAFCGVALAFSDHSTSPGMLSSGSMFLGDFLGLLAGITWGATTVIIRTKLSETPPTQTGFMQLLTCFCILMPGAALTDRFHFSMTHIVWASLVYQILIVCVVGMLLWFWLLTVYPASQLGVLCFLTPVFGIVFGVVLLGESADLKFILGAAMVLAGIVIVSGWQWFAQRAFRKRELVKI